MDDPLVHTRVGRGAHSPRIRLGVIDTGNLHSKLLWIIILRIFQTAIMTITDKMAKLALKTTN